MSVRMRLATIEDVPRLEQLIRLSATVLGRDDYSQAQIEAALKGAWGVDTQLIRDGTYFVAESTCELVACGGWSRRKTLFGSDARAGRELELLDAARDAARIRAFFVHPNFARQGIGKMLLERCEAAAKKEGFRSVELLATLPGVRLYEQCGFVEVERKDYPLEDSITITFVSMKKSAL